uniref:Uncharacterized protein n=1 Tax=Anguilla anguilla TaxID=7936 RepID=A0A0E9VI98_ANGAN
MALIKHWLSLRLEISFQACSVFHGSFLTVKNR